MIVEADFLIVDVILFLRFFAMCIFAAGSLQPAFFGKMVDGGDIQDEHIAENADVESRFFL